VSAFPTRPEGVAVIGGGIMGGGIAALFAANGIPVTVFDVTEKQAQATLDKLADPEQKLQQLTSKRHLKLIQAASTEAYPALLKKHDLIVEAVPEILSLKKKVFAALDEHRRKGAIVATNTSGLSVRAISEGRSEDFRRHFLATHYFHPVRYLPLVELIPIDATAPDVLVGYADLLRRMGKKVVIGRDTPNFIANRVGVFGMLKTMELAAKYRLSIEMVDLLTGPPLGMPKTATFRLGDMVGLDTLVHAAQNSADNAPKGALLGEIAVPPVLKKLVELKRLGEKTGEGFFKKVGKDILTLDLDTLEYRKKVEPRADVVRVAKQLSRAEDRVKAMVEAGDEPAALFARELVLWQGAYALDRVPEVCDDVATLDDAMRWGFGRELGPVQSLQAVGVARAAELMGELGIPRPKLLLEALAVTGPEGGQLYGQEPDGRASVFDAGSKSLRALPDDPNVLSLARVKRRPGAVVRENLNARLVDLGDGVLCCELDVKMVPALNPVDDYVLAMVEQAHEEVETNRFRALVIGNQAPGFCAGANLKRVLELAKAKDLCTIEAMAKKLQDLNLRAYHAAYPVVVAPHGMTLGGGLELALGGQVRVAASELYCGLVEVGVGLVPAGGGCLRLLQLQGKKKNKRGNPLGAMQNALAAFDLIGFGKVSTSAEDAQDLGLLDKDDVVVRSKDEQLRVAKEVALARLAGFQPRAAEPVTLPGPGGYRVMEDTIHSMLRGGKIAPHAARIAKVQARILTGGASADLSEPVSEQRVLDLEREGFLELALEPATHARIEHMLKTGKPLLN
jgi:3-hydroxyacyl-CoA dehydrogenase